MLHYLTISINNMLVCLEQHVYEQKQFYPPFLQLEGCLCKNVHSLPVQQAFSKLLGNC